MSTQTQLQKVSANAIALGSQFGYTPEYVSLIKNTIAKDSTDDELQLFLTVCHHAKLNPMNKEIYFWKQQGKVIIHTGIQGLRIAAERTGRYAPGRPVKRDYDANGKLVSSTAYVKKLVAGTWFDIEETALWSEWSRDTPQWKGQYGAHQLDITAERHALKKAFPQLAGIDTSETIGDPADGNFSPEPTPESAEQLQRRHELTDSLLRIGQYICTPEQQAALEATLPGTPLPLLEERYERAMVKFREFTLSEIGQVHRNEAFQSFIVRMFPTGIDNASPFEMVSAINALRSETVAQPTADDTAIDAEPVTDDDERQDLQNDIMETISVQADGDLERIDRILGGKKLAEMSTEELRAFKNDLTSAPF